MLGLLGGAPPAPEITAPTTAHRQRPDIVVHRVRALQVGDLCTLDAIPITIVPRVLLDLAPRLEAAELTRACHEAWVRHRTAPRHVEACVARNPTMRGAAKLRRALGADITLSRLEDAFIALPEAQSSCSAPRRSCRARGHISHLRRHDDPSSAAPHGRAAKGAHIAPLATRRPEQRRGLVQPRGFATCSIPSRNSLCHCPASQASSGRPAGRD